MAVEIESHEGQVPEEKAGRRLDQTLAEMFPDFSRSRLKTWIEAGLDRNATESDQTEFFAAHLEAGVE